MQITLFVHPNSLMSLIEVMSVLRNLSVENSYVFQPKDLVFTETFVSNHIQVSMEISEYLKLKYCIGKLSK